MPIPRPRSAVPAALLALLALATPAGAQVDAAGTYDTEEWSYTGPTGPESWGRMYATCAASRQSPIDLPRGSAVPPLRLSAQYTAWSGGRVANNGHSVYLPPSPTAGTLTIADSVYRLVDIHVHVPSEHTVQGTRYAAEIHAVHQHANGNRAVIGTFVSEGTANDRWAQVIAALPGHDGQSNALPGAVNPTQLLQLENLPAEWIWEYPGSLTTPRCDQNVRWLVRANPITLSRAQVEALSGAAMRNSRPVQPANGRSILLHRGGN